MQIVNPSDGWGELTPRSWQARALPIILEHYKKPRPARGVIHAVTGSGKSVLIAQLCACMVPDEDEVVVISTSRQKLVRQIRGTVKDRIETNEFMSEPAVGSYFADAKDIRNRVIVCCNDSMKNLADALTKVGRRCALWICDELHRSESKTMKEAYDTLMPVLSIGFSATPYRANAKQGISNFDEVIFKYTIQEALDDKVIVPWVVKNWEGGETDLDTACLQMMKEAGDRGIVNSVTI